MKVFVNGAWRTVAAAKVYIGGRWRPLTRIKIFIGNPATTGSWKTAKVFVAPMSVSAPDTYANAISKTPATITANITATPAGGLGPYTYAWSKVGGGTLLYPTSATCALTASVAAGTSVVATLTVTVTDATGATATTTCDVTLENSWS